MNAHSLGLAAAQITSRGGEANVIGVTSRGLFLSIAQRVLFVSFEQWRGPLTINVEGAFDATLGDSVRLSPTRLIFPAFEVDLSAAEVWQPTVLAFARSMADQREAVKQLAASVLARNAPDGFGVLLPHLLDLPEKQPLSASEAARLARLNQLRESIQRGDFDQATTVIEGLLGLGRGLTPSGDDVIIGLSLMLARSPRMNSLPDSENMLKHVEVQIVAEAYHKTTALSANLIECAARGEADERLINVVDGLVTGTPSHDECVAGVVGWGRSSGVDALIGMTLAIA